MARPFEPTSINGMTLSNRFIRSATWEGLANDDGTVTTELIEVQAGLARGGVALIISGHAFVSPEGRAGIRQLSVHDDRLIPGLKQMAASVHAAGGKLCLQLGHAGARAASHLSGLDAIGPSPITAGSDTLGRAMTPDEVRGLPGAFAEAAARAQEAGLDAVQIHAAHGYLMSQFLSPFFNKRRDEYGGSIENRSRILVETVRAIRRSVSRDFAVMAKVNSEDFLPDGLDVTDMLAAADMLAEAGIDAVEMSGGTFFSGPNMPSRAGKPRAEEPEAYYEAAAAEYKAASRPPLMLVGGICSLETAERLIAEGRADYVSLCRPLIREPGLVNRWRSGDRRAALCVHDNGCFQPGFEGKGVHCVVQVRDDGKRG